MRPVTQTALVEVNSASTKPTSMSDFMDTGKRSKKVPNRITAAKPKAISRPGGSPFKN